MPHKFNPVHVAVLDDPARMDMLRPDLMWKALESPRAHTIVEIGAGTACLAAHFAAMAPEATVYAADIEPQMLAWMAEKRPEVAAGRIVPVLAEETSVPLEDGSADVVYMVALHHELTDPAAVYAEAWRLLVPGGRLLVSDFLPGQTASGPPPKVRVPARVVQRLLQDVGFTDVREHPELASTWILTARKPG
jgi:ubiquinone/menaquinone biosynthesis C-methylase UbiE